MSNTLFYFYEFGFGTPCYFFSLKLHVPCSEDQQCISVPMRSKDVCGLKLQCWNIKVLVVMFCGHLRAAEEQVSVRTLFSLLECCESPK